MKKRLMAMLLVLSMMMTLFTILPVTVGAADAYTKLTISNGHTWGADNNGSSNTIDRYLVSTNPENVALRLTYSGTATNSNVTYHTENLNNFNQNAFYQVKRI